MGYRIAAEMLVVVHFLFILFVIFGGLLALKWKKMAWGHIPCLIWGSAIITAGWVCPLTPLEHRLRELAGDEGYDTGFIEHYLLPLIYPAGLTPTVQYVLGGALLFFNILVYSWAYFRGRRRGRREV